MHPFHRKHNGCSGFSARSSLSGKLNEIKRDEKGEPTIEFDDKFYYIQKEPQSYTFKESSTLTEKENILKSFVLGETTLKSDRENEILCTSSSQISEETYPSNNSDICLASANPKRSLNSERSTSRSPTKVISSTRVSDFQTENNSEAPTILSVEVPTIVLSTEESYEKMVSPNYDHNEAEVEHFHEKETISINDCEKDVSPGAKEDIQTDYIKKDEVTRNKCDNLLNETQPEYLLKKLLLASNKTASKKWLGEGFVFNKNRSTCYGLTQSKEGCSGVLAAVNAYIIKELLFKEIKNDVEFLRPQESQLEPALLQSIAQILWQAGANEKATIMILENRSAEIKTIEDVINNSVSKTYESKDDLESTLEENLYQFTQPGGHGCLLLLISAVLSRGVEKVIEDMNGVPSLINTDGYSSLESVNLLLSGSAVPNVFDNHIRLQFTVIKGIPKRSDIGYLSIKEHFKCCKVGSYLKTPRFPIWLLHYDNHFSLLFSCQKQLLSDWKVERKFIMTYYDPQIRVGGETHLSIDTTRANEENHVIDNVKAAVEHCVRTKWKEANISWT